MPDTKDQIVRITRYEAMLDEATQLLSTDPESERLPALIKDLEAYYTSDAWKQDYADDEAGRLPADLKRGVLSEDGWLRTGDLATVDSKGRYFIKGRLGNMIVGPSGENIYPEEIEGVINGIRGVNESLVVQMEGKLVALVKFDESVLNWNQEGEDKFFENLEARKKAILEYVNKHVSKQSKISEVEPMKGDFEKTATNKIRRFLYKGKKGVSQNEPDSENNEDKAQ